MDSQPAAVREVFEAWVETIVLAGETAPAVIDKESAIVINSRLKEGIPVATLIDAVHGWQFDPWPERRLPKNHLIMHMLKSRAAVETFRKYKLDAHAKAREPDEEDRGWNQAERLFGDVDRRDLWGQRNER